MTRRRLLAPEVVQSSAMDCGPAALQCLLEGHGIRTSYDELREACQTDVDGTSIDTLEDLAVELGLDAEQVLVPADHVPRREAGALPALAVVALPSGVTHFVVLWSRAGRRVQVMDPAAGRRWTPREGLLPQLYRHVVEVSSEEWRAWASSAGFLAPLRGRLRDLGLPAREARARADAALATDDGFAIAALDACCRMVASLASAGAVRRGPAASRLMASLHERALAAPGESRMLVPPGYWFARPGSTAETVRLTGAVLVRVRGVRAGTARADLSQAEAERREGRLAGALGGAPLPVWRLLADLAGSLRGRAAATVGAALGLAASAVLVQALLLRGLLDLGRQLDLPEQRVGAMVGLVAFVAALALLELPLARTLLRAGRHVEARLRVLFQSGLPRLSAAALRSRPSSDMAERAHSIVLASGVGTAAGQLVRILFQLVLTTAGIAWLAPGVAPLAAAAALAAVLLPALAHRALTERELCVRTLRGALSRLYLEALLGLVPLRTHGAERTVRSEHEGLLAEWWRATLRLRRGELLLSGVQSLVGIGLLVALVTRHFGSLEAAGGTGGSTLLLCYWALSLPALGQELALTALRLPVYRNVTRRLLEPLSTRATERGARTAPRAAAPGSSADDAPGLAPGRIRLRAAGPGTLPFAPPAAEAAEPPCETGGVAIELRGVGVRAAGHDVLRAVDLEIAPGDHVAIVGASGAGKSTLVGLLLGSHEPSEGALLVDGAELDAARRASLLRATAWVDPSVQLFNRSLFENLRFGNEGGDPRRLGEALDLAHLDEVVGGLPGGLQGKLGEAGGLVSGGEGQRVRLARAACREGVRLAVLDEPFRGLARDARSELLSRARELWAGATLLCITHDLAATSDFDRVVVVDGGRVVEVGRPGELRGAGSRYAELLELERRVDREVWGDPGWRRVHLEAGRLREVLR